MSEFSSLKIWQNKVAVLKSGMKESFESILRHLSSVGLVFASPHTYETFESGCTCQIRVRGYEGVPFDEINIMVHLRLYYETNSLKLKLCVALIDTSAHVNKCFMDVQTFIDYKSFVHNKKVAVFVQFEMYLVAYKTAERNKARREAERMRLLNLENRNIQQG